MITLQVVFNDINKILVKRKIRKMFFYALKDKLKDVNLSKKMYFEVNISYVSKSEMQSLNKKFRNINKPTDVLSFPMLDFNKDLLKINLLGDILICEEIAERQSKELEHSLRREIYFLALHGFLHLLGYNHEKVEEERDMIDKMNETLNKYKVRR